MQILLWFLLQLSNKIASLEKKDERVLSKHSAHIDRLQTEVNQLNSESCSKDDKIRKVSEISTTSTVFQLQDPTHLLMD